MKLQLADRRIPGFLLAISFAGMTAIFLSVPGCVRSPRETASNPAGQIAAEPDPTAESEPRHHPAGAPGLNAKSDRPLVAQSTDTQIRTVGFQTNRADGQAPSQSSRLLNTILRRRREEQNLAQSDPFVESSHSGTAGSPPSENSWESADTTDRSGRPQASEPRTGNAFSKEFDQRLALLRQELDARERRAGLAGEGGAADPLPEFLANAQRTEAVPSRAANPAHQPASEDGSPHRTVLAVTGDETREDDYSWIAAEPPAAAPRQSDSQRVVQHAPRQPNGPMTHVMTIHGRDAAKPQHNVFDVPFDSTAGNGDLLSDGSQSQAHVETDTADSSVSHHHSEDSPEGLELAAANDWEPSHGLVEPKSSIEQVAADEPFEPSVDGGVTLLPPIDDRFPTDDSEVSEQDVSSARRFSRPDQADAGAIRPVQLLRRNQSAELLSEFRSPRTSHSSFRSETEQRPAAGSADDWDGLSGRPVRVAGAPPLLLDANSALAIDPNTSASEPTGLLSVTRGGSGRGWQSHILWLMGGIILLMIALRLASRRTSEV